MPYNNIISRSDAEALIPEDAAKEIIQGVPEQSTALRIFRRLPNMTRKQQRMPVLSFLPTAYFVNGEADTDGQKQTTEQKWENKYINAEEIACIVPIPEQVLDDADYDIWTEIKPRIQEAIGVTIDAAVFHGTNAPANWPDDIVTAATSAGNAVALGTGEDIYDDLFNENGVFAAVEADGFGVDVCIGAMTMKARLRGLRDANGQPIYMKSMSDKTSYELDGAEVIYPKNGALDATSALMIAGQAKEAVYSIRQDITYKVLEEAVIQDSNGDIVFNLAQQDMIALRCVMRMGWQLPNPINRMQPTEGNRYPFGVLTPAS
jgi:HK97 family phage major capsid protein